MATGTGCGNWVKSGVVHTADPSIYKPSTTSYSDPSSNGGYPGDTSYTCSNASPVTAYGGADRYTVCSGNSNSYALAIHGNPSSGKSQVVVFPVDVISSSSFVPNFDSSGNVMYAPADASSGTAHVSFSGSGLRINGAFVVTQADAGDMYWCLQNGAFSSCPAYSYQRFGAYDTGSPGNTATQ
jgi:hypothetical protein